MKKAFFTIILCAILPLAGFAQITPYKGSITITAAGPDISDGQATYHWEVNFSTLQLSSTQMIEVTPVLTSADGLREEQFAPVIIMGKQCAQIVARDRRLNGFRWTVEPSQIIVLKGRTERRTQITTVVPLQDWMYDAKLTVVERTLSGNNRPQKYGSGLYSHIHNPDIRVSVPALAQRQPVPQAPAKTPSNSTYRPEFRIANVDATAKTRTESFAGRLSFAQNNSLINRTLGDNAVVLAETDSRIRAIESDPLREISAITVRGFASPEGEVESNRNLAADRARTFVNYLGNVHNLRSPNVKIAATGIGEDWAGLRNLVERSTMDDRYLILDVLDNYADIQLRRNALQELKSGMTYAILLNYYSALRRVEYTVEYTVAEPISSPRDNFDAVGEIKSGNYDEVIARLSTMNTPQAWNNIGVCYWCKGDYERTLEFFYRAADAGSLDAQENLRQYDRWLENRK